MGSNNLSSYTKHLAEVWVSEAERDVGDVEAFRLGLTWPLLITSTSSSSPWWHRHAQRLGVRGHRGQNILLTVIKYENTRRRRRKRRRNRGSEHVDRRRMDEKEQTKTERWKTKDGKRKSMNEMRVGVKKKQGEGISRKAKKERGGKKSSETKFSNVLFCLCKT